MNKTITPTTATIAASVWFSNYLNDKLAETGLSAQKLASDIGIERKAIYAYLYQERSPKLDLVAKVLAYFGEDEIVIPIARSALSEKEIEKAGKVIGARYYGSETCGRCANCNDMMSTRTDQKVFCEHYGLKVSEFDHCEHFKNRGGAT